MKYKCNNCGYEFNIPVKEKTTYEEFYGLNDGHHTPLTLRVCPNCKNTVNVEEEYLEDWEEFEDPYDRYMDEVFMEEEINDLKG